MANENIEKMHNESKKVVIDYFYTIAQGEKSYKDYFRANLEFFIESSL